LSNKPADRPQSAEEVASALKGIAETSTARSRFAWRSVAAVGLCGLALLGFGLGRGWPRGQSPAQQSAPKPIALEPRTFGPFVLHGKQHYPSLKDAIDKAEGGAVIEIEGDGPYATPPIHLAEKALTIRAAPAAMPVLVLEAGGSADSPP